jgi:hypothetical protein
MQPERAGRRQRGKGYGGKSDISVTEADFTVIVNTSPLNEGG